MLKRWAARLSSWARLVPDRWVVRLLWVLAVFVFLGALVAAIWWLPSELTRHPSAGVNATARLGAENAARAALVAALAVVGAAGLTARYTWQAAKLTGEGQITDRYTKAIEQLGSKDLHVRIGGIYALERIARDSARDHPTVMEVLTAFIREHSREPWPPPDPGDRDQGQSGRRDIQAALSVVGRRDAKHDTQPIDLVGVDLTGAGLADANLSRARLSGADLSGANLTSANLTARTSTARTSAARTSSKRGSAQASSARTSAARTSTSRALPVRASAARTSAARTSAAPGGPNIRQFRRAGNWTPALADWSGRALIPGRQRRTRPEAWPVGWGRRADVTSLRK